MILGILVCAFALSFSGWIIFFATNITDNSTLYQQLYQSQSLLLKDCLVLVAVFSLLLFEGFSVFSNSFIIEVSPITINHLSISLIICCI